ncbi:MAG: DUF1254 domain-containing protein [Cytophaga sp.]|uniref:DUF1254 domain-containing protein n=1 Tax=Cytophaga sp. TaxID=29535 RepID=UPI003F7E80EC
MKKRIILFLLPLILASCNQNKPAEHTADSISAQQKEKVKIVKEAFVYTLPLVIMDITRRQATNPDSSSKTYAPVNAFRHMSAFPDASFRNVVRPNADTYYSSAMLDLTEEPVVLSLPNTNGRYYMMPMLDAYTNVFSSPGTRTTGNGKGDFLITGPDWSGAVPAGMKQIAAPTNLVWIIGRTQVNSKVDGDKVVIPLQQKYKLVPLSAWGTEYKAPAGIRDATVPAGDPNAVVKSMSAEEYFTYANQLLQKYPAGEVDKETLKRFAVVGVGAGLTFDINTFGAAKDAVTNLPEEIIDEFHKQIKATTGLVNGWAVHRGLGAYGTDYLKRAFVAYMGLGANLPEDAMYPSCAVDADGNELNGANNYVLHFDKGQTPPVNAFWSLTMYSPEGYLVDNALNRYTLGDRSNLKKNADGSVDLYIQHDSPGKEKESNWLPAPAGEFNLLLRLYWPKPEMIEDKWTPPAVEKRKFNN